MDLIKATNLNKIIFIAFPGKALFGIRSCFISRLYKIRYQGLVMQIEASKHLYICLFTFILLKPVHHNLYSPEIYRRNQEML